MILHVYDNGYNRIISFSFLVVQSCPKLKLFINRKTATKQQQNGIICTNDALSCLKKVVIFSLFFFHFCFFLAKKPKI